MIKVEGSVRVDLLGGTLDLNPINLILENVMTLNVATSLKSSVVIEKIEADHIHFISKDYDSEFTFESKLFEQENWNKEHFGPLWFLCEIIAEFNISKGLKIQLESGSPAGAGLGGSSAMGVTFFKALYELKNLTFDKVRAIKVVQDIEAKILDSGPAGYQDYYPALYGGILALHPNKGEIRVEQLYDEDLKKTLETRLTLINSKESRLSGINNWEVYKGFFDKNQAVRDGMNKIAKITHDAYLALKDGKHCLFIEKIKEEGNTRKKLFSGIMTSKMEDLFSSLAKEIDNLGVKVCGAGGGGCFLLIHGPEDREAISKAVQDNEMEVLDFKIERPLSL